MSSFEAAPPYLSSLSKRTSTQKGENVDELARSMLRASLTRDAPSTPRSIGDTPGCPPAMSPMSTTSRTRRRLAEMEKQRDELLQEVGRERVINDRLKREARPDLSSAEKEYRFRELKKDMRAASRDTLVAPTASLFKSVCSTDLLFLIDATGSMHPYISAARDQCTKIVESVSTAFLGQAEVRMAVVSYKDHADSPNIQFLDFTTSTDRVRSFLADLDANGGGDEPEDVLGGLKMALNATWMHQTRCIIHIADAPPHGHSLQDPPCYHDDYSESGSEPHGLTHPPLLSQMLSLKINYALLRINGTTDRMTYTFAEAYANSGSQCKLHTSNRYYTSKLGSAERSTSKSKSCANNMLVSTGLIFEELYLGVNYEALQHLVLRTVSESVSRTAVRATTSIRQSKQAGTGHLLSINEEEEDLDVPLETVPPQWNRRGWLDETLEVEGFSPDIEFHSACTLDDMIKSNDHIKMSIVQLTIHKRSRPFAQGAIRTASYAQTDASSNHFVAKTFKKKGKRLAHVAEDMQGQALCKAFALEFNALVGGTTPIDFLTTTCLKGPDRPGSSSEGECLSLEPYVSGEYIKYNSNSGGVRESKDAFNLTAQAFTHFTFERSRGQLMVSDLQGSGHILTDPCIHTADKQRFRLSDTNLNESGFMFFFTSHECNDVCRTLGLKSNRNMYTTNSWHYRENWPKLQDTVCCSNKLCGKIVRSSSAQKSPQYPGDIWCNTCWPQLKSFEVRRVCVAAGDHHEFTTSAFFHESQGRAVPRKCDEHRLSSTAPRYDGRTESSLSDRSSRRSLASVRRADVDRHTSMTSLTRADLIQRMSFGSSTRTDSARLRLDTDPEAGESMALTRRRADISALGLDAGPEAMSSAVTFYKKSFWDKLKPAKKSRRGLRQTRSK